MALHNKHLSRQWFSLLARIAGLLRRQPQRSASLVRRSYDRIAAGYDEAWTHHMRDLSVRLLEHLDVPDDARCLDLTCGTGFVTAELAGRTTGQVVGVDASAGMLDVARRRHGDRCAFVEADALEYLRSLDTESLDVVTCGWGLGYTRPWPVVRQVARVLRRGGSVGVIDNTMFSLAGVVWASLLTFAEQPQALEHALLVRFLPGSTTLATMMRACHLSVGIHYGGRKTYFVPDGQTAIARLTATGAAAGFEFAANADQDDRIFARFAEILEQRSMSRRGIPITHRYLAAVGRKT